MLRSAFTLFAVAICFTVEADQVGRAFQRPPQIVEDNSAVLARILLDPVQRIRTHEPLGPNHSGPLNWNEGWVNDLDTHEDRDQVQAQDLGIGWESMGNGNLFPPDCIMAVGPNHVIAATNIGFRIYDKTGNQQFSSSFNNFFASVEPPNTFVSDPQVMYDHYSGRWFLLILAVRYDYYTWYMLAVSDDDDPNGTWKKYAIDSALDPSTTVGYLSDYPGLGVDDTAIYVQADMFERSNLTFVYDKLRVFPKQQLLDFADTIDYVEIYQMTNADGSTMTNGRPANHYGATTDAFIATTQSDAVNIIGVDDPLGQSGGPTLIKQALPIPTITVSGSATQPGGSPDMDTIDIRPYNSVYRNGYVYFGHNSSGDGGTRAHWYQVDVTDWPNSVSMKASGSIASTGKHFWFPSVAVNKHDILFVGSSYSSDSDYASIYYSYRLGTDPDGASAAPALIQAGEQHYIGEGGATNPVRWGDYTGSTVDPADDETFWHFNEFPKLGTTNNWWTTRVQSVSLPFKTTVEGHVDLEFYFGPAGQVGTIDFRNPSTLDVVYTRPIVLDADSDYSLNGAPVGTYDVSVLFTGWLRQTIPSVILTNPLASGVDFAPLGGNADSSDNVINLFDINAVLVDFAATGPDPADLNYDGVVDLFDINIVLTNFGTLGDD